MAALAKPLTHLGEPAQSSAPFRADRPRPGRSVLFAYRIVLSSSPSLDAEVHFTKLPSAAIYLGWKSDCVCVYVCQRQMKWEGPTLSGRNQPHQCDTTLFPVCHFRKKTSFSSPSTFRFLIFVEHKSAHFSLITGASCLKTIQMCSRWRSWC